MEVIQFPLAKGLLDFDGMGIKIEVEEQRKSWGATFTCVQTALLFCNLDHAKAEKAARAFINADILDETGSQWADTIDYLEATVAIMKAALVRLEVSEDRALRRKRRIK
jgi:hypothetical protein